MPAETAPTHVEKAHYSGWRRLALSALLPLLYVASVLLFFGGVTLGHLPQSLEAQLGMVAGGAGLLLLLALWLDRREARRAAAEARAGAAALEPAE
jgi:protein-S-isoprenylcysteine O-methyltransferase Ste14